MRYGAARPRGHRGRGSARIRFVTPSRTILLTGATGYVGVQLLPRLLAEGHDVRCLVRDVDRARAAIGDDRVALVAGGGLEGGGRGGAAAGADVAYYLVHSMAGGEGDFARLVREPAPTFGGAIARGGVPRPV